MKKYTVKMADLAKVSVTFLLVTVPFSLNAQETQIKYNPTVKKVIFYPDRAMVIRNEKVTLKKDRNLLIIENAPVSLEKNSLRAYSDNKEIMIQSIHSYKEKKMVSSSKEIRELENELKRLSYNKDLLESEKKRFLYAEKILESFEHYLKSYISYSNQRNNVDAKSWAAASDLIRKKRILYQNEREKIEENRKELIEEETILHRKLNDIRNRHDKTIRIIEVRLISEKEISADLYLSYITQDAGWKAAYAFHLMENPNSMKMIYYGDLYQKTGENWKNINVELSTSRPALGAQRPDIYALGIYGKKIKREKTDYYSEEKESAEGSDDKSSSKSEDKDEYRFSIPHKISIQSREQTYRLKIFSSAIKKYHLHYRLFPAITRYAHIMASFKNESDIPFLSGNADLYRNGSYAGKSVLPYTPSQSAISMGFGMDRNIKIVRKKRKYSEETGIFTSGRKYRATYDTSIQSQSKYIREIHYYERLPVSETESVVIKLIHTTTKDYEQPKEHPGILKWKISLNPGKKKDIHFEYTIEGPSSFHWNIDP